MTLVEGERSFITLPEPQPSRKLRLGDSLQRSGKQHLSHPFPVSLATGELNQLSAQAAAGDKANDAALFLGEKAEIVIDEQATGGQKVAFADPVNFW